ncbi:MAG: competence/damage-inducible protein A [Planctomycetaceae bacterium]
MSHLTAVVIAIGDEMTSGAKLDTNTQWLCQRLAELGISVRSTATVGDDLAENVHVFKDAASRADFVVATGGLGPTADDLTRQALAEVAQKPLVLHEASLRHIESLFAGRGREMPPRNRIQAMLPEGAFDIFNPRGTAPGIDLTITNAHGRSCRVFALPGVPAEMKVLFVSVVAGRISDAVAGDRMVIRTAVIKCFGLGESEMESRLGDMISRQSSPRVGITVSAATISLRICALGPSEDICEQAIAVTREEIHAQVGEFVFGEGETFELQDAVAELLSLRGETVETIEIGHASPIAGWLSATNPRDVFRCGRTLGNGAPGPAESAIGPTSESDWILSVDAYPSLGERSDTVSDVSIRIIGRTEARSATKTFRIGGHPSIIHARIGKSALSFFRQHLLALPPVSIARP